MKCTLLIYHLFEFLIGQCVLLFEVILLDREGGLELLHLVNCLTNLLETNIEMKLLLFKITPLLIVELDLKWGGGRKGERERERERERESEGERERESVRVRERE